MHLSQKLEELMQEKKELELKNKVLSKDLATWQDHVEELWGSKVCRLLPCQANVCQRFPSNDDEPDS